MGIWRKLRGTCCPRTIQSKLDLELKALRLTGRLEDWYLALVQASSLHPSMDDVFSYEDMQDLVKTIDAEQDPIPTRWLNAILGRVFFGLYRTAFVEEVSTLA
jgi:hypothetical protein